MKVAQELGIPDVQLWTASACSFIGYLHFRGLLKRGVLPFKDVKSLADGSFDSPIDWIPGLKNIRFRDSPNFIKFDTMDQDIMIDFLGEEAQGCLNSSSIIFNTFDALEQEALKAIRSKYSGNIYQFGPLTSLIKQIPPDTHLKSLSSSLWREDSRCLEWLDSREPSSVMYVNYGSVTVMSAHHLEEFAWGLANSKHPFLWIIRPDILMDDSVILAEELLEEIKDRGLMVSWCPQEKVLSHSSVGAFLTHCGWNPMLESVTADCVNALRVLEPSMLESHCIRREDVEGLVKEVMGGTQGKHMRGRAQEWKKKADEATSHGGSSHNDFERFITEASHVGV
ncbi:hypothetical protein Nepgr_026546 [Nepenthes gracilis]|uniref:Uncharacterized protein n=1 Tax=Nepenthes gracilis TaxID=150966 RepID=A0AAD3Y0N6_NEPGR|nr:hypothetical protein Nepgr_026546 [Nepenthes gracilis]